MAGNKDTIQYRIEFPAPPSVRDIQSFTCPNDVAHYAVEESGIKQDFLASKVPISKSLLTQKLHGVTASLTVNEYLRVANILTEEGKREWAEYMFRYFAAQLLPPPTYKEKLRAEKKSLMGRIGKIDEELDR